MAVLENTMWKGEPLKALIKFDANTQYEVATNSVGLSFLKNASFKFSEGNNRVMPLGICTSNTVTLEIYDADDNLSPGNVNSPYYGKIVNGVEIEITISYDGTTWEPYGTWYTTYWGGGFFDGAHDIVTVTAEDKLNTLGNMDLPSLPAYANVQAGDLIANVMNALHILPTQYTIDSSINQSLYYGVTVGGKVRDFLNNICQILLARVIIDRSGVIKFVPAMSVYSDGNEVTLTGDQLGALQNKNSNNIDYNKICVKYLKGVTNNREQLFDSDGYALSTGVNTISDIKFNRKVLSVENVQCLYSSLNRTGDIAALQYQAYQDGIVIMAVVTGEAITNARFIGEGIVVSTEEKQIKIDVSNASVVGGITFEFDTKQMMEDSQATDIANAIESYLSVISKTYTTSGTVLTPKLYIGDKVTVTGTDTMYDGNYKVTDISVVIGENYKMDCTFVKVT